MANKIFTIISPQTNEKMFGINAKIRKLTAAPVNTGTGSNMLLSEVLLDKCSYVPLCFRAKPEEPWFKFCLLKKQILWYYTSLKCFVSENRHTSTEVYLCQVRIWPN